MREGLALLAGRGNVEPVGRDSGCGGNAEILWTQEDGVWKMQWDSWNDGLVE